jgi:hypothetical protein
MMNIVALVQLKSFARQDGVFLALLWIASFLLVVLVPTSAWGNLLALSTPFFVGWLLIRFRNNALDGSISFLRGYAYSCYTFFYASLIFAVAQYVFFRYFDNGNFLNILIESVNVWETVYKEGQMHSGPSPAEMKEGLAMFEQLTPIQLTFIFMMQNLFFGALLSLPIAFFCKKKPVEIKF